MTSALNSHLSNCCFASLQLRRSSLQRTISVRLTSTTCCPNSSPLASSNHLSLTLCQPLVPVSKASCSHAADILFYIYIFTVNELFIFSDSSTAAPAAPPVEEEEEEDQEPEVEEGDLPDLTSFTIDDMKQWVCTSRFPWDLVTFKSFWIWRWKNPGRSFWICVFCTRTEMYFFLFLLKVCKYFMFF